MNEPTEAVKRLAEVLTLVDDDPSFIRAASHEQAAVRDFDAHRAEAKAILAADPHLVADIELGARIRDESARGVRFIAAMEDVFEAWGTRNEAGDRLVPLWGQPDEFGIYTPMFLVETDEVYREALNKARAAFKETLRTALLSATGSERPVGTEPEGYCPDCGGFQDECVCPTQGAEPEEVK